VVDTCTFTGDVSDDTRLCQILSSADLAVVPDPQTPHSDKSTMNKVVEYMFFGLPMVAFDLRENRFSAQGAAVYVGDNSPRAMAECIADLLGDPSRRREMALIGQNRVRDQLAWQHSVPHLLAAYQKALEAR
jgi:glycosyltransferase involved in cell wall biosynthesis